MMMLVGIDDLMQKYRSSHQTLPEEIELLGTNFQDPNRIWLASALTKICQAKKKPIAESDMMDIVLATQVMGVLCGGNSSNIQASLASMVNN